MNISKKNILILVAHPDNESLRCGEFRKKTHPRSKDGIKNLFRLKRNQSELKN